MSEDFELENKKNKIRYYLERLSEPEEEDDEFSKLFSQIDPKKALAKAIRANDINELKKASVLPMQMNMIRLATEAENESIQYNATAFILGQNGQGPVQKVDHNMTYAHTPIDQLAAMIRSKLSTILKYNPDFSIEKLVGISQESHQLPSPSENNSQNIIEVSRENI